MKLEEHTALIRDIRTNLTDEGKVTELLTKLSDDYGTILTTAETEKAAADKIKLDNESLRDVNMRLFLKVGNPVPGGTDIKPGDNDTKLSYDTLFNEKGGLK